MVVWLRYCNQKCVMNLKLIFIFTCWRLTIREKIYYLIYYLNQKLMYVWWRRMTSYFIADKLLLCGLIQFHCSPDIWLVRVFVDAADACWLPPPPIERVAPRTWSIGIECISSSANWSARCSWISIQQGVSYQSWITYVSPLLHKALLKY